MFIKRSTLGGNRRSDTSNKSDDDGIQLNVIPNSNTSSDDANDKSFRRSIRDGTIKPKQSDFTLKPISNTLSFTDEIMEDKFDGISIRINRKKRGIMMKIPVESTKTDAKRCDPSTNNLYNITDYNPDVKDHSDTTERSDDSNISVSDTAEPSSELGLNDLLDVKQKLDKCISLIREESELLSDKLVSSNKIIKQKKDALTKCDSDRMELEIDLSNSYTLLESARCLGGLIANKSELLNKRLNDVLINRIDSAEYFYRMHRWIKCDMIRLAGYDNVDYNCADLEDVDEYGNDISIDIKNTFNNRIHHLTSIADEYAKINLNINMSYKNDELIECEIVEEIKNVLMLQYTSIDFSKLYNHTIDIDDVDINIMDDAIDKYRNIYDALSSFESNTDYYTKLLEPLTFYANLSLLSWDPLKSTSVLYELDWYKFCIKKCPSVLPRIFQNIIQPLCIKSIESWDVESYTETCSLTDLLISTMKHLNSPSTIIEKLIKTIEDRIPVVCIKVRHDYLNNHKLSRILKFHYMNIIKNILCFSEVLSITKMGKIIIDTFIEYILPLLQYGNKEDAFISLHYKSIIVPALGIYLDVKNKNNSIFKSFLQRFIEEFNEYSTMDLM